VFSVFQPSIFRITIWPDASKAQNSIAAVSADGQHGLRFDPPLELFMQTFNGVCCSRALPLRWWQRGECEQRISGFLEAVCNGFVAQPPFADERLSPVGDVLWRRGVDHVGVVGRDLVMETLRRARQQVPMLVNLMPMSA